MNKRTSTLFLFLTKLNPNSFNPVETFYLKTKPETLKPKLLSSKIKQKGGIKTEPKDLYSEPSKPSFFFFLKKIPEL